MNRILELAGVLQEGKDAMVYIMNPGRHGWDRVPVKVGDQLVRENGDAGKFVRLDGNKIVMTNPAGKEIKVVPSDVACKILQAGQKPDKEFFKLDEAAGGKRQGAINMIAAASGLSEFMMDNRNEKAVKDALGLAYDAGMADAHKAAAKNLER
jgi:hypothetical protein